MTKYHALAAVVFAVIIAVLSLLVPERADGQGFKNFFDTTTYPNLQPVAGDIMIFAHSGAARTCTVDQLTNGTMTLKIIGTSPYFTTLASLANTSNKTMTFPNVSGNVVSTGDTGTVTNTMLAGSITAAKLVGTDIATVGTITAGVWNGTTVAIANGGTGQATANAALNAFLPSQTGNASKTLTTDGSNTSWAGVVDIAPARMTADATKTNTTFANLSDMSITLSASTKYVGRMAVKCINSTATEGIKFDFNGGTATMTSFWAGAGVLASGGTDTVGTNISTSLAGVINFTVLTGETVIIFDISMVTNGAGTFIPRFAEDSTAVGTATVRLGSYLKLDQSGN